MPSDRLHALRHLAALASFAAFAAIAPLAAADEPPPVHSVAAVELPRYLGKWYEIASFPLFFQRVCRGDTTAEYALRDDGELSVVNRCRSEDGFAQVSGRAWAVEDSGNARLKVQFFWPFRADYWVIGLDPDYRWAVVGNPNRRYLWILSRTPVLPPESLASALQAATAQAYPIEQLRYTRHGADVVPAANGETPADAAAAPAR